MKRSIFFALVATVLAVGCNQDKLNQLEQANLQLNETTARQDSLLNDFLHSFNEIEDNLALIKEKEQLIEMSSEDPELSLNQKDRILEDIQSINSLMGQNKELIADLNKKLKGSNSKVREFRRMVARLNKQIAEKDTNIVVLKETLANREFEITELNTQVADLTTVTETQSARLAVQDSTIGSQVQAIEKKTEQINTAYYIVGTTKELVEKNILAKGGLLGKKGVNANFDESHFQRIDLTETYSIPVENKKAKVMTFHPTDSYVFNDDEKVIQTLEITDPQKFWKQSRYLVVVLN